MRVQPLERLVVTRVEGEHQVARHAVAFLHAAQSPWRTAHGLPFVKSLLLGGSMLPCRGQEAPQCALTKSVPSPRGAVNRRLSAGIESDETWRLGLSPYERDLCRRHAT